MDKGSTCNARIRTRFKIPEHVHVKQAIAVHIFHHSAPKGIWELETGEFPEACILEILALTAARNN